MDLKLVRKEKREAGIFSELLDNSGNVIAHCLEHAYEDGNGGWAPKITDGVHKCVRGDHELHGMTHTFSTFEITGVVGHHDLLFHWGNYNKNSEGCILVGQAEVGDMITASRAKFEDFMKLQEGLDEFQLTVETP